MIPFKIPNWNVKARPAFQVPSSRVHRARRGHALQAFCRSKRAAQVNISIMRAFVRLREMLATHKDLARELQQMEKKYDAEF